MWSDKTWHVISLIVNDKAFFATLCAEVVPKEEAKEQMNSLPEDLSKLLNFAPNTLQHVPHWFSDSGELSNSQSLGVTTDTSNTNSSLDVQNLASLFPVASATSSDYAQTPASWDALPGICKGCCKHTWMSSQYIYWNKMNSFFFFLLCIVLKSLLFDLSLIKAKFMILNFFICQIWS